MNYDSYLIDFVQTCYQLSINIRRKYTSVPIKITQWNQGEKPSSFIASTWYCCTVLITTFLPIPALKLLSKILSVSLSAEWHISWAIFVHFSRWKMRFREKKIYKWQNFTDFLEHLKVCRTDCSFSFFWIKRTTLFLSL